MYKCSIADDASRIKGPLPHIGQLQLDHIHDGTLAPYVEAQKSEIKQHKTIINGLDQGAGF